MLRWLFRLGRAIFKSVRPSRLTAKPSVPPQHVTAPAGTNTVTADAGVPASTISRLSDKSSAQTRLQSPQTIVPAPPHQLTKSAPADPQPADPFPSPRRGYSALLPIAPQKIDGANAEEAGEIAQDAALTDAAPAWALPEIYSDRVLPASFADEPGQAEQKPLPSPATPDGITSVPANLSDHNGGLATEVPAQIADATLAGTAAAGSDPVISGAADQASVRLPHELARQTVESAVCAKEEGLELREIAVATGNIISGDVHAVPRAARENGDLTLLQAPTPELAAQPVTNAVQPGLPGEIAAEPDSKVEIVAEEQSGTASDGGEAANSPLTQCDPPGIGGDALQTESATATHTPAQPLPPAKRRAAVHRDRRGSRRAADSQKQTALDQAPAPVQRRPSELRLRLELDRRAQSAFLSAVASRGEGLPDAIDVDPQGEGLVNAFDEHRYDDVPLDWTGELLSSEIRLRDQSQGLSWLHSARTVHIFTDEPGEPDLLSSAAAITGRRHVLIVPNAIARPISALTELAGSPPPMMLAGWRGVPDGWSILDGYVPVKAIAQELNRDLKPLDPGHPVVIALTGGLQIKGSTWAEGSPPEIRINPLPANAEVTIGPHPAEKDADGRWTAAGHEAPGTHIVDVVPGPSASYTILPDPARAGEWKTMEDTPFRLAGICGASAVGSNGRPVLALASPGIVIAIGARGGIHVFAQREGFALSFGEPPFEPEFLLMSWGQRRTHGQIVWLGRPSASTAIPPCGRWTAAVRAAAARQLDVAPDTPEARQAWRLTVTAARNSGRRSSQ